jgi:acetyl esterase
MNVRHNVILASLFSLGMLATAAQAPAAQFDISPEQLEKYRQLYPDADTNKDGKLSLEEARAYLKKMRSGEVTGAAGGAKAAPQAAAGKETPRAAKRAVRSEGRKEIPPSHADVSYGPHPNNKLDLWLAKSDEPTPLVVFIHGGGFVGGDKGTASAAAIRQCLDAGVSFAAINYRFRTELPIQDVLRDCARAIQFLRSKSKEYNLDKSRVAAFGGSAGAGTSLWLAFHDDLADPKNPDPVLRESSRLSAAAATATQATYDILKWKDVLGDETALRFSPQEAWPGFYGLKSAEDLQSEQGRKIRADVDMLGLITKDDPPVMLASSDQRDSLDTKGNVLHHPKHAIAVKKRCDEVGVPAALKLGNAAPVGDPSAKSPVDFLLKHLGVAPPAKE